MAGTLRNTRNRPKLTDKVPFIETRCLRTDYRPNWTPFCPFTITNSRSHCGVLFVNEMKENSLNSNEVYVLFL